MLKYKINLFKQYSYQQIKNIEVENLKKANIQYDDSFLRKPFKKIKTRYGFLKLYKHNNFDKIVILVHGIRSNVFFALRQENFWTKNGYTIITYDNFGFNDSKKFGLTTFGNKESKLLKDVIDFVKKNLKYQELIVHGESMGGATLYGYLGKFGNKNVDKFIINAGYINIYKKIIWDFYEKINIFAFIIALFIPIIFLWFSISIKPLISKKNLCAMNNVYHIHGANDKQVSINCIKPYIKCLHYYQYKKNVRHVMGWIDAKEEHNDFLIKLLKKK